ncbi:hypothetical protein CORMATOL_03184 [Corynebacterium matruchotii ATCC 33806]|uniref:Uncharacterized protein n=1 Tax=Corynebacterium matruchotii ATCC 33806 TaxID=566549 RepID=C0E842_9CORY|nr:hypothetical protein CORMATOL_03184 [Corynebacterium matruchotii ATCC 33806]
MTRHHQWFLPVSPDHHPPPIPLGLPCAFMRQQPTMGVLSNLWTPPHR